MNTINQYSGFLNCIHDEPKEYGAIGRGCHYSVFRVPEWFEVSGKHINQALVHDFAVVWDEDHDTRVIEAIEQIYLSGLLFPVLFVGERKGCLTLILSTEFEATNTAKRLSDYRAEIFEISQNFSKDPWPSEFGTFEISPVQGKSFPNEYAGLIASSDQKVDIYLQNIANLWLIGSRKYRPPVTDIE